MRPQVFGLLLLMLLAVFPAWAQQADLSGRWYGEGYQGRVYLHWLSERRPDGGFAVEFRRYEECKIVHRSLEAGRWSLQGNVYTTSTIMIDGQRVNYADRYLLLGLGNDEMTYQHITNGTMFRARKVGADFDWPVCDPSKLIS
ncbi:hypothetical protein [Ferrovibrio sp.]|uniref:hypothetical protein n=1 Tax=Ferrovibrio sp. TaxID=1917215 RepID=UPI003D0DE23C